MHLETMINNNIMNQNLLKRSITNIIFELYFERKQNRKNITNGEIIMNQIDPSDKIDADTEITDYDDTLLEVLEMEPEIT